MGLGTSLANIGGLGGVSLPSIPVLNLLGAWESTSTGTSGAGGTLSLNDLSGNSHPLSSTSGVSPLVLTGNDPVCGGSPTVHSTLGSNGAVATIPAFTTPISVYFVGYTTINGGDLFTLGVTIIRLFIGLSGSSETWTFRLPTSGNQVSDAHGVNTTASVVCCTVPITAGTFNSYVGQSTPATGTGTIGVIPVSQTQVEICSAGGNPGGVLFGLYIYSGTDPQATRFATMNVLATRANLPAITS